MPRKTRATVKANADAIHMDETATEGPEPISVPLPATPQAERQPLVEITANPADQPVGQVPEGDGTPSKMGKGKSKKRSEKKGGKAKKAAGLHAAGENADREIGEIALDVVLDANDQPSSPASEITAGQLISSQTEDNGSATMLDGARPEPENHQPQVDFGSGEAGQKLEQLFSPQSVVTEALGEPSISDIIARNPSKASPLKEDPIVAMDALEEAIEEVGRALPKLDATKSVVKATKTKNTPFRTATSASKWRTASKQAVDRDSITTKPQTVLSKSKHVPDSAAEAKKKVVPTTPPREVVSKSKRSAISALHTPPPMVKSSKPVTKSDFKLPSEEITAKLKAQKEERLKRQEEAAQRKIESKARPPVKSTKPVEIRQTATSRARMSIMGGSVAESKNKDISAATIKPLQRGSLSSSTSTAGKRMSTLAHRPKPAQSKLAETNSSTVRHPRPSSMTTAPNTARHRVSPNTNNLRASAVNFVPISVSGMASQKQKVKEVFNRDRAEKEDREKSRRDKEEAARKARVDAAERGRAASREWAEKMKLKNAKIAGGTKPLLKARENAATRGETAGVTMIKA